MLGCNETVTVVKCDGEAYTATVFEGVSWFDKTQVKTENSGLVFANAVRVRIPADAQEGKPLPAVGDHIIRGGLPEGTVIRTPAELAAYHPRKVMAVGDNRRGGLPHVTVTGQ